MKADFLRGLLSTPPELLISSELLLEWKIANSNNTFQSVLIANYHFQSVHRQIPPHLPPTFLLLYAEELSVLIANDCFRSVPQPVMS